MNVRSHHKVVNRKSFLNREPSKVDSKSGAGARTRHLLVLQRARVWFPAPTFGISRLPGTPFLGNLMLTHGLMCKYRSKNPQRKSKPK